MMMQENLEMLLNGNPNFAARSTTGTTRPRRLVTPRIQIGVFGTVVTVSYSTISVTFTILIAYSSPAVKKVRYCAVLRGSCFFWSDAPIISLLTFLPVFIFDVPAFPAAESAWAGGAAGLFIIGTERSSFLPLACRGLAERSRAAPEHS